MTEKRCKVTAKVLFVKEKIQKETLFLNGLQSLFFLRVGSPRFWKWFPKNYALVLFFF